MEGKLNFLFAILAVLLIASLALTSYRCSRRPMPTYFATGLSLDDALETGRTTGKPVFAVFVSNSMPECREFVSRTLTGSKFASWATTHSHPILVDLSKAESGDFESVTVAQRFHIAAYPTVMLFRDGAEVARHTGAVSARELLKWIETAAAPPPVTPEG